MSHDRLHNLICGRWVDRCIVAFAFLAWGSTALQLARGLSNMGLIPQLGFPSAKVEYARSERFAGESKYPLGKMLALAWQGVTSFSAAPLRAITTLGLLVSIGSIGMGFWALWVRLFSNTALPGWASTVIPLFLLSGVQLLSLGVIGEYLAKIFIETKKRPMYFIEKVAGTDINNTQKNSNDLIK